MSDVMKILKKTSMNNCGECGYPTCMAFSVAVATGTSSLLECPNINEPENACAATVKETATDSETMLLKELRGKTKGIVLSARADDLGAKVVQINGLEALELPYLGDTVRIDARHIETNSGMNVEPRDQILLYNYIFFWGRGSLSGTWVGLESFPNSISKVVTLKKYTEDKLSSHFENSAEGLKESIIKIGGKIKRECHADVCATIFVLPKVPIQINFWNADKEDGFPASVKVLFDSRALDFLDIESLIFASERMAETLCDQL